jgi:hypothetical protein
MKALYIILGIILVILLVAKFLHGIANAISKRIPKVDQKYDTFELEPMKLPCLFTSVQLSTNAYKESSSKGFSF